MTRLMPCLTMTSRLPWTNWILTPLPRRLLERSGESDERRKHPNLILPLEVLSELQSEGLVGPSCENHYSFMGHIEEPHLTTLIQKSSVEAAKEIRQQNADIALLVPA